MTRKNTSRALLVPFFVLGSLLWGGGVNGESEPQALLPDSSFETPRELQSERNGNAPPFADYERRMRQSPRWQSMNAEEQARALEKIDRARKHFLDRQQKFETQYGDQIKKTKKPRESLMSKRRKREQNRDANSLWERFQALPVKERLDLERQLGLDKIMPSQQQRKFQEHFDRLLYSKQKHILRQLQQTTP